MHSRQRAEGGGERQRSSRERKSGSGVQCRREVTITNRSDKIRTGPSTSQYAIKRPGTPKSRSASSILRLECGKRHTLPYPNDATARNNSEEVILSQVKKRMKDVQFKLQNQDNTKLNTFLKTKIKDLETDKRELVGVFGRSGAGKSSLINAIIGEKDLLPTGSISACTTVMIKVEANMHNSKYEADIEFITKEDWDDELWPGRHLLPFNTEQKKKDDDDDDDDEDFVEKLTQLFGEEWKHGKTYEELKDHKQIRDLLQTKKIMLSCESAEELSKKLVNYTRRKQGNVEDGKRWYWPLVKCVTVKVPKEGFLQHVTLVDLPGSGDYNKSRDKMWKEIVGKCSTVWIVTEINRAATEKETWEILEHASSIMGNGGECHQIHFICTKSDQIDDSDDQSPADRILTNNKDVKKEVKNEFNNKNKINKHFKNSFEVFTVSAREFLKEKHLKPDDTEIPKLQDILQNLYDKHSETLNYVSGAYGILSLIQGARCREGADRTDVCAHFKQNLSRQLHQVKIKLEEVNKVFEKCLSEGVENSTKYCGKDLNRSLTFKKDGRGFHRTLKCVVENNGIYKPKKKGKKKGTPINLNMKLSSYLTDSIDEEFKKTFPNDRACEPFNGVISRLSLNTIELIQKYKDVELQLIFLQTEEEIMKRKLNKYIREQKKTIYNSLTATIAEDMKKCYERAASYKGDDTLKNMKEALQSHVRDSKSRMFDNAKTNMLEQLDQLKEDILKTLRTTMKKAIELSLKTDDFSFPDVSTELGEVKKIYNDMKAHQKRSSKQ
ncbi:nuclear GTPase SLIP-GC-like isoform X2 [Mugil cephalus]|nr:nuclear GTPase SLIP-GC-like isoform X2 [Mugil cephalus]XP_047428429.1 nuclear GTPase SLIP-GC-like isoform X2 [Mugil cephalus]